MFPGGVNPRQMKQMMKKMGISMEELDATQVIIKCVDQEIIIDEPQVVKTKMQGQDTFQISGQMRVDEVDATVSISQEDVEMVAAQAGVSAEKAAQALDTAGGDLAQAILDLKS